MKPLIKKFAALRAAFFISSGKFWKSYTHFADLRAVFSKNVLRNRYQKFLIKLMLFNWGNVCFPPSYGGKISSYKRLPRSKISSDRLRRSKFPLGVACGDPKFLKFVLRGRLRRPKKFPQFSKIFPQFPPANPQHKKKLSSNLQESQPSNQQNNLQSSQLNNPLNNRQNNHQNNQPRNLPSNRVSSLHNNQLLHQLNFVP